MLTYNRFSGYQYVEGTIPDFASIRNSYIFLAYVYELYEAVTVNFPIAYRKCMRKDLNYELHDKYMIDRIMDNYDYCDMQFYFYTVTRERLKEGVYDICYPILFNPNDTQSLKNEKAYVMDMAHDFFYKRRGWEYPEKYNPQFDPEKGGYKNLIPLNN